MLKKIHFLFVRHNDQGVVVDVNSVGFIYLFTSFWHIVSVKKLLLSWTLALPVCCGVFNEIEVDLNYFAVGTFFLLALLLGAIVLIGMKYEL